MQDPPTVKVSVRTVVLIPVLPESLIYCLIFPSPSAITTRLDKPLMSRLPELPSYPPRTTLYCPLVISCPALIPKPTLYPPEVTLLSESSPIPMFYHYH